MSERSIEVVANTYLDSVKLLAGARAIQDTPGVEWGTVVMGTAANLESLAEEGFDADDMGGIGANDVVIAVGGESPEAVKAALARARADMFDIGGSEDTAASGPVFRSLAETSSLAKPPNLALVSVGGAYATLEAHKALTAGMDVLLFSDNVSVEREIELKRRGRELSRFVMGPGAGTAMIDGLGLGLTNAVNRGPIGVVAAAGTGAQEVMTLIHRAGLGVSHVIGVGGRDLSAEVGGLMTSMALDSLENDPSTEAILLVSKPPSAAVARRILARPGSKPLVASLIGLDEAIEVPGRVTLTRTLEEGVTAVCTALGSTLTWIDDSLVEAAAAAGDRLGPGRTAIRGLFSGGTLCYEAMTVMAGRDLAVYSNTPLRDGWSLGGAPHDAHICLDMGDEEFTKNRPHPMIDPRARFEAIEHHGGASETAVILLDVVLGYGSHDDPAGLLAPVCRELMSDPAGPQVVAYVLGTDADHQDLASQRRRLEEAGCIVAPTNVRGALTAIAIATRSPDVIASTRRLVAP